MLRELLRVPKGINETEKVSGKLVRACHRAGPQEGLRFPDKGPPPVVLRIRIQGPHHGAVLAFRTEVGVHHEHSFGHDGRLERLGEEARYLGHNGGRLFLGLGITESGPGPVYVDDVRVGAVADLPAALPAHGHHQHIGLQRPSRRDDGLRYMQSPENRCPVRFGQGQPHLASWSSSPALSAMAIRRISRRRISRISRMALSGSACRDILDRISCHWASKGIGTRSLSLPSQATDSGETSSRSEISRELASTWQSRSAAAVRIPEQAQVPVGGSQGLADPAEGEQSGVGIHALGEPAQQDRQELPLQRGAPADACGECLDVPHGALRVQVAQRGEAALGGLRA